MIKSKTSHHHGFDAIKGGYIPPEKLNISPKLKLHRKARNKIDPITYEVVSHYFNQSVSKKLDEQLLKFGLNLGVNENYSKEIILNSESDINNTALEIANIFESVFNFSVDLPSQNLYSSKT